MSQPTAPEGDALKSLAAALGRVPSGLFVVTFTNGPSETGMLASWVQQCSFDPPAVSMAVRRDREVVAWLSPGAPFTINILAEGQNALVSHFAKGFRLDQPAFEGLEVERPDGAAPVLRAALAWLNCRVMDRFSTGDHDLFIGRVVAGQMPGEGRPRVHVRKNGLTY